MPEIPVYNAGGGTPPTELRPNPAGVEATAQAGWRIGRAFDQSGADIGRSIAAGGEAFQQHVASQEITQLAPLLAAHRAQRDAAWNAATSQPDFDPFNPTARINAMQTIATDYSNLEKGVTTKIAKDYLQRDMLQETERFNMQTIGDIAQLSANKTLDGAIKTSNIYLQNITDNPSSLDANIGGIHSYVQSMIQLHGAQMGDKGIDQMHTWEREQETAYTVRAYEASFSRATTPEAVDAISAALQGDTTHSEFLDQDAVKDLVEFGNSRKSAIQSDQRYQDEQQRRDQEAKANSGITDLVLSGVQPDGSWKQPPNYVSQLTNLAEANKQVPGFAEKISGLIDRAHDAADGKYVVTNQQVFSTLEARARLPAGAKGALTEDNIISAQAKGLVSRESAGMLHDDLARARADPTENQMRERLSQIMESFKPSNQIMMPSFGRFQQAVWERWDDLRNNGKMSPTEAEHTLTDPKDPNYIGKLIGQLAPSTGQLQGDATQWYGNTNPLVPGQ